MLINICIIFDIYGVKNEKWNECIITNDHRHQHSVWIKTMFGCKKDIVLNL